MRTVGLVALAFLVLLMAGRLLGRDVLIYISITCNLILFALTTRRFFCDRRSNR